MGDNALILGHRLGEWCGHAPEMEIDMALANIALDLTGQARNLYQRAAEIEGLGKSEDDIAYLRDAWQFRNVLLVEYPNGDFACTIARQFLFDAFNYHLHEALIHSSNEWLAGFAGRALKEIAYHLRYSSEWVIRLGDGTAVSHEKMQNAFHELWMFTGELTQPSEADHAVVSSGEGADLSKIKPLIDQKVREVLEKATLQVPATGWMQSGGKEGRHTEHLGYILSEMQFLQRAYPGLDW